MSMTLGIDLGGSFIKWTVAGGTRNMPQFTPVERVGTPRSAEGILKELSEITRKAEHRYKKRVTRIGMGTPGLVDENGRLTGSAVNVPGWRDIDLSAAIEKELGKRVFIKNDTTLAAFAEAKIGAGHTYTERCGRPLRHALALFLGTGIGAGIYANGQLYEGFHHFAGEIGHTVVERGGEACSCGHQGCLERYAAAGGITRLSKLLSPDYDSPLAKNIQNGAAPSPSEILDSASMEDPLARAVVRRVTDYLAAAIGAAVNLLAPQLIILGGGVMQSGNILVESVRSSLPHYALPDIAREVEVLPAALGSGAGAVGAALFAQNK